MELNDVCTSAKVQKLHTTLSSSDNNRFLITRRYKSCRDPSADELPVLLWESVLLSLVTSDSLSDL